MSNNVRRVSDSYRTILIYQYLSVYVKQYQTMSNNVRRVSDSYKQIKIILLRLYKRVKQKCFYKVN